MKARAICILIITFSIYTSAYSQETENTATAFDFWVGKWDLTWQQADGSQGKGYNHILKILDDNVIQENFEAVEGNNKGFKGTSISVYNPRRKSWHQAWADNQGGYFNFIGEIQGDKRIFKTLPVLQGDKEIVLRMVFYNITNNSFNWDWERSVDGGESWNLRWRINYQRKE